MHVDHSRSGERRDRQRWSTSPLSKWRESPYRVAIANANVFTCWGRSRRRWHARARTSATWGQVARRNGVHAGRRRQPGQASVVDAISSIAVCFARDPGACASVIARIPSERWRSRTSISFRESHDGETFDVVEIAEGSSGRCLIADRGPVDRCRLRVFSARWSRVLRQPRLHGCARRIPAARPRSRPRRRLRGPAVAPPPNWRGPSHRGDPHQPAGARAGCDEVERPEAVTASARSHCWHAERGDRWLVRAPTSSRRHRARSEILAPLSTPRSMSIASGWPNHRARRARR